MDSNKSPRKRRSSSITTVFNTDLGDSSIIGVENNNNNNNNKHKHVKHAKKSKSILIKSLFSEYPWLYPLSLMIILNLLYYSSNNQTESNILHRFIKLSYEIKNNKSNEILYDKGWKDFAFVIYMMVFFTFLREFVIQILLKPLAKFFNIKGKSKISRFTEQTYAVFYYGLTSPLGLFIMYNSSMWFFKTEEFYRNYPHRIHNWLFKFYYLFQAGFWSQQAVILLLQIEKPRKDYQELVFHHIVTILLISLSYMFNYTHMGLGIYITMDVSDFFLGLSKTLNYIGSPIEMPFFVLFMFVWIYTRHYLNLKILWSICTQYLTIGPSILDFESQQYKCWISQPMVFILLFALQLVNAYWLFLIFRILFRFLVYNIKKDERSDSEEDDDDEEEEGEQHGGVKAEVVGEGKGKGDVEVEVEVEEVKTVINDKLNKNDQRNSKQEDK